MNSVASILVIFYASGSFRISVGRKHYRVKFSHLTYLLNFNFNINVDEFTNLLLELKNNIDANREFFQKTVTQNPTLAYYKLNELSNFVGSRHGHLMEINFPDRRKIVDIKNFGTEKCHFIFDKFRKTFPN